MTRRRNRNRKVAPKRQSRIARLPSLRMPRIRVNWKAVLLPPATLACIAAALMGLQMLLDRPVGKLVIEGTFQRVTPRQVEALLVPELDQGFLSLDLMRLHTRLQELAWVDHAQLRRAWPDSLIVRVIEHRAAARWSDTGLLNTRGELFAERRPHSFPELPKLAGPEGSEREVAKLYLALRGELVEAHLTLDSLSVDERGSWRLVLGTGQEVRLGRHEVEARAARFFRVAAPALGRNLSRAEYVDLRYTNGFAVGWLDESGDGEAAVAAHAKAGGHG